MDANSLVIRHWEDVVFENRNKSYGAYSLRRAYSERLLFGLAITLLVVTFLLSLQLLPQSDGVKTVDRPPFIDRGIELTHPPSFEKREPARTPKGQPRQNIRKDVFVITTEEVVEERDVAALTEFIAEEGTGSEVAGIPDGASVFSLPEPELVIEPDVVDIAEVMPQYEGGAEAMMRFIQRKIRYPRVPRELGIEGTVYVRFIVMGDGSVSEVEVIRGVHPDYDREAKRVIAMLPSWKGGRHNGRPVSVRMVLPIKFNLQ